MTTKRNNRFRLNTLVAGAVVALLAGSAIAQTSSQQPTPKPMPFEDPITSLPIDFILDPLEFDDPTEKDDTPPYPISYVDIPEIDRSGDDGSGDFDNPLGSVAQPEPITPIGGTGGIFDPLEITPDPFRPTPGASRVPTYPNFRAGGGVFFPDVIVNGVNIHLDNNGEIPGGAPFASIPTPGTLVIGGLALGAVARRRRR